MLCNIPANSPAAPTDVLRQRHTPRVPAAQSTPLSSPTARSFAVPASSSAAEPASPQSVSFLAPSTTESRSRQRLACDPPQAHPLRDTAACSVPQLVTGPPQTAQQAF